MADRKKGRSPGGLAVAGLLATLVAACGNGSSSGSASSQGGSSPVTFSVVAPLTGTYATDGVSINEGSKAAAAEINAAGGVLGRRLQVDQVDTVGDPGDAVPALNKELAIGKPSALIGPVTLEIHAVEPMFDRAQIVDGFNGGSTQFDHQTDKWLWRCNASDSELGVAMAVLGRQKGYHNAVLFFSSSVTSETLKPVISKAFEALGGKIVGTVDVTANQASYLTEVQKVVNLHPDVIFTQLEPSTASVAFGNFKEVNNLAIPFIGTDLEAGADFIRSVGPAVAQSHMVAVQGSNALTANGQNFQRRYQQVNGHAPLAGAAYGYDCVKVFALAITKAGTSDPRKWVGNITQVSNPPGTAVSDYRQAVSDLKQGKKINYEGASGPMDFDRYHNVSGAWDVVQANGDAKGETTTLDTISATTIQQALKKEGAA
jgi:branched-chain amino acid transport system substrate-binding protein